MLVELTDFDDPTFLKMIQDYEGEFAAITGKEKDPDGKYSLDTDPHPPSSTYYWIEDGKEVGFCIRTFYPPHSDIGEFYP